MSKAINKKKLDKVRRRIARDDQRAEAAKKKQGAKHGSKK